MKGHASTPPRAPSAQIIPFPQRRIVRMHPEWQSLVELIRAAVRAAPDLKEPPPGGAAA